MVETSKTVTTEPITYKVGNPWQQDRYKFMAHYNSNHSITEYGKPSGGKEIYGHLLARNSKNELHQFLGEQEILNEVQARYKSGKLGDYHRLLINSVASQPCCFNLFVPLKSRLALASNLFSHLMGKEIQVRHIELEFTPYVSKMDDRHLEGFFYGGDESLGDQSPRGGTDADVAVFYTYGSGERGVILIEFKYIESEFSICTSYKNKHGATKDSPQNKNIRPKCDTKEFYNLMIATDLTAGTKSATPDCGYLKYKNWQLLEKSTVFDQCAIKNFGHCPFRYSLQQLWRNMLLAENVAQIRNLDEFYFWVLSPEQNSYLWQQEGNNVEKQFQKVLKPNQQGVFARKSLRKDFVDNLKRIVFDEWGKNWVEKFEERYL